MRNLINICLSCTFFTTVTACSVTTSTPSQSQAEIFGSYPITSVDGIKTDGSTSIFIHAGQHQVNVLYGTTHNNYHCTFLLNAKAATRYEVVDHKNTYPITLYQWNQKHIFWATRKHALNPDHCEIQGK